jgi:hypothetical protein
MKTNTANFSDSVNLTKVDNQHVKNTKSNFLKAWIVGLILLLGFGNAGWGQTYYSMSSGDYTQAFTGWAGYATNWNGLSVLATGSIPVATKTTTATTTLATIASSTAIGYDVASSTKLVFLSTGTTNNTVAVACDLNLDFTGRNAGTISFDAATINNGTGNRVASLKLYYSIDGTNWIEITGTNLPYVATNNVVGSASISVTLPAALNNQSTVKLRFYQYNGSGGSTGSRPKISIDNISVTSTPAITNYTVTYNGNGSSGGLAPIDGSSPYSSGATVTILGNTSSLVKTGYSFSNWNTASDGTGTPFAPTATFTINANTTLYARWLSFDETLSALTLSSGTLSPTFASGTISYSASVTNATSSVSVTPTFTQANASIQARVNSGSYSSVTSGTASGSLALNVGDNTIDVLVTAQDGTTKTYTITVNRASASSPTITIGSISGYGNQCINTTSSEKSYNVSGANLTANISIAPPTGYEISTGTGGSFVATNPIVLTQSGGTVTSTTIYVRFSPTIAQLYSDNITHTSTGATQQDLAVSGTGTPLLAPSVSIAVSSGSNPTCPGSSVTFTATPTNGGTPSYQWKKDGGIVGTNSATYTDAGSATGSITCEMTTSLTCVSAAMATCNAISLTQSVPNVTSPGATAGNGQVSVAWSNPTCYDEIMIVAAPASNTGTPTGDGSAYTANLAYPSGTGLGNGYVAFKGTSFPQIITGLTNGTIYYFKLFTRKGSVWSAGVEVSATPVSGPCFSEDFASIIVGNSTATGGSGSAWTGNSNFPTVLGAYQAGGAVKLGISSSAGSITSTALTGVSGDVTVSFDVKGWSTVEGDIKVTLNGVIQTVTYTAVLTGSFENKSVLFSNVPSGSTLKIETTAKRAFIDNISLTCTPSSPSITITTVTDFGNVCTSSTSAEKTYNVSGLNLTEDVVVNAPTGFEVSKTSGSGFASSVSYTPTTGTLATTPVYVRFTPTLVQSYSDNITHTSAGATTKTVALTGAGVNNLSPSITTPTSASIASTTAVLGGNITSTGCSNVTERGIYWSTTNGFADGAGTKVSVTSGPYSTGVFTINVSGLSASTTYYYKAFATNSNGTTYTSQASFVTTTPSIAVGTITGFGNQCINSSSAEKTFTISGSNLIANVDISAPAGFEISTTSGIGFATTVSLAPSTGNLGSTTIYVRFAPTLVQAYTTTLSATSTSAVTQTVSVTGNGNSVPTTPVCSTPTAVCSGISATITGTGSANATSYTYWTAASTGSSITTGTTPPGTVASNNLTTPTSLTGGTYTYYVQAENSCGSSVARQAVTATINSVPNTPTGTITPAANPACGSTTISFSGASASIYWETTASGVSTSSPTTSAYSISSTGTYYARGYNGNCWSSSSLASSIITINTAPAISTQPTNQTVNTPTTAMFSITATGAGLTYQWQLNSGSGWGNVSGANSDFYITDATTLVMNGYQYRCVVSGTCSPSVTSNAATLTVTDFTYLNGDWRPLAAYTDLTWSSAGNWERYNGSSWVGQTASPETSAPTRIIIDKYVSGGGAATHIYNDIIIINGGELQFFDQHALPTALLYPGKKLEVQSGGILRINGDINIPSGTNFIVRNGGTVVINQPIKNTDLIWSGTELFEETSEFVVENFDNTSSATERSLLNPTYQVTANASGYRFGNITYNFNPATIDQTILPATSSSFLFCNNLTINNLSTTKSISITANTQSGPIITIAGNVTINQGHVDIGINYTDAAFQRVTIKGNLNIQNTNGSNPTYVKLHNFGSGTILSDSKTYIEGDLTIASGATLSTGVNVNERANSYLIFSGGNAQTFNGAGNIDLTNITIDKTSNNVSLTRELTAKSKLALTAGNFILGSNNLILGVTGTPGTQTGGSSNSYVVTNGSGIYTRMALPSGSEQTFPIGPSTTSYNPAYFNYTGTTDNISARVETGINPSTGQDASFVNRTWNIEEGTPGGTNSTVKFQWVASHENASFTRASSNIYHYSSSAWAEQTSSTFGGTTTYTSSKGGITSFSPFIIGKTKVSLPVELINFNAICKNKMAEIKWTTATEINNSYFIIERSNDSKSWEIITQLPGAGNSSMPINYSYVDNTTLENQMYRLIQVDYDGKKSIFGPISLNCNELENGPITIYPNPFSDKLMLNIPKYNEIMSILFFDATGKRVLITQTSQAGILELNTSDLAPGIYSLKLVGSKTTEVFKVIKQ